MQCREYSFSIFTEKSPFFVDISWSTEYMTDQIHSDICDFKSLENL